MIWDQFGARHRWTCCFPQVLSPTANPGVLDIIYPTLQFRYIYSCALFVAQGLGQTVRIFFQFVVFFTFLDRRRKFLAIRCCTHYFPQICQIWWSFHISDLTSQLRKTYTKMANFKMSAPFCPNKPSSVNLQSRTLSWTIYTFLRKVAKYQPNDSCAECFDANFDQKV